MEKEKIIRFQKLYGKQVPIPKYGIETMLSKRLLQCQTPEWIRNQILENAAHMGLTLKFSIKPYTGYRKKQESQKTPAFQWNRKILNLVQKLGKAKQKELLLLLKKKQKDRPYHAFLNSYKIYPIFEFEVVPTDLWNIYREHCLYAMIVGIQIAKETKQLDVFFQNLEQKLQEVNHAS